MGWTQTKKLFLSKGYNQECEERVYRVGENLFHTHFRQSTHLQVYRELLKLYTQDTKNPINILAKELIRYFKEEDIQVSNKYMKKCSSSLVIREMQIKTT